MSERAGPAAREPRSLAQIIFRNTAAALIGSALMKALNAAFMILTARLLSDVGLGLYASVVAFVGLFGPLFELGLSQYVERSIAQDRARLRALFWNLAALRLLLALVALAAVTGAAAARGMPRELVLGVALFSASFTLAAAQAPLETLLSSHERYDLLTAAQVVGNLVTIIASLALLYAGAGFLALLYAGFIAMPAQIAVLIWQVRRAGITIGAPLVTPRSWPALVRASLPFGVIALALTFNFNVDTVILSATHSPGEVGAYSATYRLVFALVGLAGAFLGVITPSLARVHTEDAEQVRAWTRGSVTTLALLGLPVAGGALALAGPIVELLYGASFAAAGPMLAAIALDVPLLLFTALCGNVTSAVGLERPAARVYMVGALINLALNLLVIPRMGGVGAALVTVVTDAASALLFYRLLAPTMQLGALLPQLARIALAAALMAAAVWWLQLQLGLLALSVVAGALIYGALAIALGALRPAELAGMARRLTRRPAPTSEGL